MSEIAERVKNIIVDKLGVEASEVTTEASFTNDLGADRKSTRLNSSHYQQSRMPSSA